MATDSAIDLCFITCSIISTHLKAKKLGADSTESLHAVKTRNSNRQKMNQCNPQKRAVFLIHASQFGSYYEIFAVWLQRAYPRSSVIAKSLVPIPTYSVSSGPTAGADNQAPEDIFMNICPFAVSPINSRPVLVA
jgi:hypothetical protein